MKTWKHCNFWGILAILTVIVALIACDNGGDTAHTYQWGNWIETTAPTCTEAGIETRTCSLDAIHTETKTGENALGHNFGDWTITNEATETEEGEETRTCYRCEEIETRSISKLLPTYDTVTINLPATNADTVKSQDGNENIINRTFVTSGAQFNAIVTGSNNPIQNVTWEIISTNHQSGTSININTGILIVASNETHGKEITIKATSTADTSKFETVTIIAVQCLPSDFYGTCERRDNGLLMTISEKEKVMADSPVSFAQTTINFWDISINTISAGIDMGYINGYVLNQTLTQSQGNFTGNPGDIVINLLYRHVDGSVSLTGSTSNIWDYQP
jgi:hypothetical protein